MEETEYLLEQYKDLGNTARNQDMLFWNFPTSAFGLQALAVKAFFDYPVLSTRLVISFMISLLFSGFLFQLTRYRGYQIHIQGKMDELVAQIPGFVKVSPFVGQPKLPLGTFWFIRIIRFSSTTYMIIIMLVVEIINITTLVIILLVFVWQHCHI